MEVSKIGKYRVESLPNYYRNTERQLLSPSVTDQIDGPVPLWDPLPCPYRGPCCGVAAQGEGGQPGGGSLPTPPVTHFEILINDWVVMMHLSPTKFSSNNNCVRTLSPTKFSSINDRAL